MVTARLFRKNRTDDMSLFTPNTFKISLSGEPVSVLAGGSLFPPAQLSGGEIPRRDPCSCSVLEASVWHKSFSKVFTIPDTCDSRFFPDLLTKRESMLIAKWLYCSFASFGGCRRATVASTRSMSEAFISLRRVEPLLNRTLATSSRPVLGELYEHTHGP